VVVGAGLAGLAAAGGLSRAGWQVTLLERAERIAAPPTALILWPNGRRALESLDPDGGWSAIASPLPDGGVRRPDGQWLVPPRSRDGAAAVHREDLYDALVAGLGDRVEIRTGVEVTSVRAGHRQRPAVGDGHSYLEADLIVAADGIDSPVRRELAPSSVAVGSGFASWQAVIPAFRTPDVAADGETLGAGYRFVSIPLGKRGVYWVATAAGAPRPEPPAMQLSLLRRWFAGWHSPVGELLAATSPADLVPMEVRELRPLPKTYVTGGVVLLGDAAHAMPHHLGQGACLAFEDAATLRSLVAAARPGPALAEALEEYDRVRHPRTTTVVRQNRRMSAVVQTRGRLAVRARDAALKALQGRPPQWTPPG
jgi:2-polyprenyl-6-methoxyphenol hydroxylase-like FAD-dependent oxidoreductase